MWNSATTIYPERNRKRRWASSPYPSRWSEGVLRREFDGVDRDGADVRRCRRRFLEQYEWLFVKKRKEKKIIYSLLVRISNRIGIEGYLFHFSYRILS